MAKRRREPEEKPVDWGFDVEPFNEEEMVLKEARGFRSALVVIGWSLVAAIVSFLVWNPLEHAEFAWELTLLVGLAVGLLLKWVLPLAKVPIAEFKRKDWFGTGMTFFFSWLAFLLLLANPPIHDGSEPAFQVQVTPRIQEVGGEVFVYVVVGDNEGVAWDSVELSVVGPGGPLDDRFEPTIRRGHFAWRATLDDEGDYEVHGSARDVNGNAGSIDRRFRVVGPSEALTVRLPDDAIFNDVDDKLIVRLAPCEGDECLDIWRVIAYFPDGANVSLKRGIDGDKRAWFTSPLTEGESSWGGVGNTRLVVRIQEHASMQHALYSCNKDNTKCSLPDDATISKGPYNVTITEEFPLEDEPDKSPKRRALRSQPAAGLVAVAAAILIAAGLARRRKMN